MSPFIRSSIYLGALFPLLACKGGGGPDNNDDTTDTGTSSSFGDVRLDGGGALENDPESTDVRMCMSGGNIVVAWVDGRSGTSDIWVNASSDSGETWLDSPVNVSATPGAAHTPSLACSGGSAWLAWEDTRGSELEFDGAWVASSTNGGGSWAAPIQLAIDSDFEHDVNDIHLSADGSRVLAAWAANPGGGYDIYAAISTTGGTSFGTPVRVESDLAGASYSARPLGALPSGGAARVIWEDRRSGVMTIRGTRSTDDGASWDSDSAISDESAGDAFNAHMVVDGDETWVAWHQGPIGERLDIFANHAAASGAGFATPFRASGGDVGEKDDLRPRLAATGGLATVAWYGEGGGGYHIWTRMLENGAALGEPFRVDDAADDKLADRPTVAAGPGTVAVGWEDNRHAVGTDATDLYIATTRDDGTTWQDDDRISGVPRGTAIQTDLSLGADADFAYAVWSDDRAGNSDVYFTTFAIPEAPATDTGGAQ